MGQLEGFFSERALKTTVLAAAIKAYTGSNPVIEKHDDFTEISFTPEQVATLQQTLTDWHEQKPGTVRMNTGPVLLPYYLKRYWLWILECPCTVVCLKFYGLSPVIDDCCLSGIQNQPKIKIMHPVVSQSACYIPIIR